MSKQSTEKDSKKNAVGERVRSLRARFAQTQEEFAQDFKITRSYLSQIESGVKIPGPKFMRKLTISEHSPEPVKWNLPHSEGKAGSDSVAAIEHTLHFTEKSPTYPKVATRDVPLLSWAQAGFATSYEEIPADWQDTYPAAVNDRKAFALQLRGDSMEPKFSDGDIAIVLPDTPPRNGDLVVANVKEQGCTFKLMHLVGGDIDKIRLSPYNPVYPALDFSREQFHWIYPVDSVNKRVRR